MFNGEIKIFKKLLTFFLMKSFLIKINYEGKINLAPFNNILKEIKSKHIALLYSIQFSNFIKEIKNFLKKKGVTLAYTGQVVGCNFGDALKTKAEAFIYVGDGLFHPLNIIKWQLDEAFLKNKNFDTLITSIKSVYIFNPLNGNCFKLSDDEIQKQINALKARWLNFNKANNYGIILSIKPGQLNIKAGLKVKKYLEERKKKAFLFLTNNINFQEFQNFKIDFWIITACPGFSTELLDESKKICNLREFFIFENILKSSKAA